MQALNHLTQLLGNTLGLIRRAVFQQHAEFVTAQPCQGIAFAQARLQHGADMA
ncbi:hypothetical protein D3C81_1922410 [compost metagenome]